MAVDNSVIAVENSGFLVEKKEGAGHIQPETHGLL